MVGFSIKFYTDVHVPLCMRTESNENNAPMKIDQKNPSQAVGTWLTWPFENRIAPVAAAF